MIEGHWFTTIGMSPHAAFNTVWAAYLEYEWCPSKITVFRLTPTSPKKGIRERLGSSYREFESWHKRFTDQYHLKSELKTIHCEEEDYKSYVEKYQELLRSSADFPRAIDITPGRKFASAIGMEIGIEENVGSIFYLHLLDDSFADVAYPQIPKSLVKLVDFKKGVG
ncbi:MAG: hypothetical protein ACFFFC_19140 [Candidatus Thorarchaeota archaeon]